ncbi:PAS domain S-box protein [bacterium]|nr:PAS domain S-box protein [bacterium]
MSEKIYEELYSKADILYFVIDKSSNILSLNVTSEEKLGYEKHELAGKNFLDLASYNDREKIQKSFITCFNRGYIKGLQTKLKCRNGKALIASINGLISEIDNGKQELRLFVKDVTDEYKLIKQKNLSVRLGEFRKNHHKTEVLNKLLESTLESFLCSGVILFLKKQDNSYIISDRWDSELPLNIETDTFRKVNGESINLFIEEFQTCVACERSEKGSVWISDLENFLSESEDVIDEKIDKFLGNFKTLSITPVINSGLNDGWLITTDIVSYDYQAEDVLFLESIAGVFTENKNQKIFEPLENINSISHQLSIFDVPFMGICLVEDGKIIKTNKWIEGFFNSSEEAIIGRNLIEFVDTQFHDKIKELSSNVTKEEFISIDDVVIISDNGDNKKAKVTAGLLSSNGTVKELWYFLNREEHDRVQRTLLQARKMESLGMLAGGIVHDFNNLLACILGFSSLLSEEISPDNPYYDDIRQITVTAEKATELTSRLMAHTQGNSYIVNDLDINQLVKEVAGILSRTLDKSISIRAQLENELDRIQGDASQIQQAILQVALNARDAMVEGGKIIFKTRNMFLGQDNPWLKYGGKPGKYIQIEITDTGQGMSGTVKERILKTSGKEKVNSLDDGMGIPIVKEIIEKNGGFLSIFSQEFKGTVVKMHFPVKTKEKSKLLNASEEPILGKETILLVDDEKVFRETARKMLTRYGYKVISAESRSEALAIYKKYLNRIDLIILDMMMPGMEVKKVLNIMKKMNQKVKIITTSEMGEEIIEDESSKNFVSGFVQKPFQVRPLLNAVRTVLNA